MTRVLLITGARSLATRPGAEAWARGLIAEALRGCDLLIVGDAPGPDAWARGIATWNETRIRCYHVHGPWRGWITDSDETDPVKRWDEGIPQGKRYPLARNAAMARDAAAMVRHPHGIALALIDPHSPTGGTLNTIIHAKAAGLVVVPYTWGES